MQHRLLQVFSSILLTLYLSITPFQLAWGLTQYYNRDKMRHPAATKFTPHRFSYLPTKNYLPGTVKKKKCIPNGQARCIARPERPNPFTNRLDAYKSLPRTRSGSTASPPVKSSEFADYYYY